MAYLDSLYETNFLEYASYVIKDRAIPHIDDGLKPVQRRILHTLFELEDGKFHKVANVVGQCMRYHPHGDSSIYSALVLLANKDICIEKQGNFGNILTGDMASAARYIECRLSPLAKEVLFNPELTEYAPSYDGRNTEPLVFPAKIPVLLAHGAEGIAVGMATRILPHNLIELLRAQVDHLQDREFHLYPDFATGGMADVSEYADGNGKVRVRARLDCSDPKRIVIREIPYGTNTENLIASIEDAARKNKVKISSIRDFTASQAEIEVKLPRGVYTEEVVDALYAFTDCETSISVSMMVIDEDGRPRLKRAAEILTHNVDRLVDILKLELSNEDRHLADRLHALTLEQIFIRNRIYRQIEKEKTKEKVSSAVRDGLEPFADQIGRALTVEDVDTLLRIPIRRISLYDMDKAKGEMAEIADRRLLIAAHLESIIPYAIAFLEDLIARYEQQFPRRTEIVGFDRVDVREAAKRDLKLRYDRKSGYLGYGVNGSALFDVSHYDRILVIRKEGSYSVIDVPDKLFVGKGMLHCGFVDEETVFSVLYRDAAGCGYVKRCCIHKFILNKAYELVPESCKVLKLTTSDARMFVLEYKPKPRQRILREEFAIADFPVRGTKAGGIRLSTRELKSATVE